MWCFAQHKLIKFTVSKVNYSNAFNNNFEYVIYSQLNGFKGFYFGNNYVFHTANNHLLFDSKAGFCDLDISKLSKKDIQPKVYFTSLKVNDNLVDTVFENDSVVALNFTEKINLNYNENSIQLSFAALSYQYSENNSYAYQLVGIDHDWKYCTAKNATAIYNLLPPGKYTFELKASNSNGIWTKQPKKLIIEIAPAFWQTWIFKAVIIGLILAIIYLIYNYRLNQILKLHQIRNRIARDLHDDIGATMSAVNITSKMLERKLDDKIEAKKLLENIQEDVKYVSESLDDIVWSINPENHEWSTLLSRMRRYASDIFENNSIQYEINFPEKISHEKLQVDVVKDFYLIFKEAVNNVAKHSQANYVKINLSIKNKIELEIKDNGIGFDSKLPSDRNGLTNMKTRAKLINADFEITSEINLGTTIILIV
jgi:two-component sensor histidine kinase